MKSKVAAKNGCNDVNANKFVTGSAKTGLIAHDKKFDLSHKHKA